VKRRSSTETLINEKFESEAQKFKHIRV
jgi:signal transduction histidine kinase